MQDPSGGLDAKTSVDLSALGGDAGKLRDLVDDLLLENDCLSAAIASLDVERLRVACRGLGTDDSSLIEVSPYGK